MEEVLDFREIIKVVFKGKWILSISVCFAMLLSGIFTWFLIPEKYESEAVVQLVADIQDTGIIEPYIKAEFTPNIYLQRIQNEVVMNNLFKQLGFKHFSKSDLTVSLDMQTNIISLALSSKSPEESKKKLTSLMEETKNQMDDAVQKTLSSFEHSYLKESQNLEKEIELLLEKYNNIVVSNKLPEILILQTIASSNFVIDLNENQTKALSLISGTFQSQLSQLKNEIDIKSEVYRKVLANYQSAKTGLDSFKADPFIRVIVEPSLNPNPTSPNKILNLAIGWIIGLIIGVSIIFLREYWRDPKVGK